MLRKRFIVVEQSALAVGGHYGQYTTAIARAARTAGYTTIVLRNRRASPNTFPDDIETRPTFTLTWGEAEYGTDDGAPMRFGAELHAALSDLRAGPGDVILVHTLGYRELLSLFELLCRRPPEEAQPTLHLLLRYDPEPLARMIGSYRPYFERILSSPTLSRRVVFHADTERLAVALSELTGVDFLHAPIPFDQSHLRKALADRVARAEGGLTILYLGDARSEKGYAHLPTAIASLWTDLVEPGRIRFVIQSNFNTPGGEAGILTAQQQLGAYADRRVRLLPEALGPADYYRHLAEADIALIPYDAERYRDRSSGVLVEAMAAGLPVVTSSGSWMETQVGSDNAVLFDDPENLADALRRAVVNYPELKSGALARQSSALDRAAPDAFIRHVAATTPSDPAAERPRVLFVMNGDAMVLRNGSSRVARSQLEYLAEANYAVVGLFLSHQRLDGGELTARRAALMSILHDFAFERVFVATPGHRWCDAPSDGFQTLAEEFANAAAYEVGAFLAGFLRTTSLDIVLLNYVTALPLVEALGVEAPIVCEMHDLQAVQRAIYGRREVRADELALEMEHLARCQHVVSLSPREATFVRDSLPGTPVTTIGVQIKPSPVKLADLAGLLDLAEVVAACGPQQASLSPTRPGDALLDASGIDVLFISSAHVSNVSGLRWFLDMVRARYLPDLRVMVAGSICDLGPWPEENGLYFVGQLDDLAPLYAAARIVILPIREGAGSAVKTYEALAYGKPIVATSLALRGLDGTEGVVAYDTPAAFAAAIEALLASQELRVSAAAAARALSAHLGDPTHYRAALDNVITGVLGTSSRTRRPSTPVRPEADSEHIEWSPVLGAINRLCRAVISGVSPDPLIRSELSGFSVASILALVDKVARVILETQPAALLRSGGDIAADIRRFSVCGSVETIVEAARIVLGAEATGAGHQLLVDGRDPLRISVSEGGTVSTHVRAGRTVLRASAQEAGTWDYRPVPDAHPHLGLSLNSADKATWSVVRTLGLAERRAAVSNLHLRSGRVAIRVTLPASTTGTSWIEFDLGQEASGPVIRVDAVRLPTVLHRRDGVNRLRAAVPRDLIPSPFLPLILEFDGQISPSGIQNLSVGWSSQSLEALLTGDLDAGRALPALAIPEQRQSPLNQLFSGVVRRSSCIRTVRPLCVSPALSFVVAVEQMPDRAGSLRCFADSVELPRTEAAEDTMSFFRAGAVSDSWHPQIRFLGPGQSAISGTVTVALEGLTDAVTGDSGFNATNLHDPEYLNERPTHRWSGADAVTILDLPTWSAWPASLEVALVALGRNHDAEDVAIAIDGEGTACKRGERDGVVTLTASIPARRGAGSTRVEVAVRQTFQPEGDPRKLGIAFGAVRLIYPFTATVDSSTQ